MEAYRKSCNKIDRISFYPHACHRIMSGIILGYYLRILRICSPQCLSEEETHIENIFNNLIIWSPMLQSMHNIQLQKDNIINNNNKENKLDIKNIILTNISLPSTIKINSPILTILE